MQRTAETEIPTHTSVQALLPIVASSFQSVPKHPACACIHKLTEAIGACKSTREAMPLRELTEQAMGDTSRPASLGSIGRDGWRDDTFQVSMTQASSASVSRSAWVPVARPLPDAAVAGSLCVVVAWRVHRHVQLP